MHNNSKKDNCQQLFWKVTAIKKLGKWALKTDLIANKSIDLWNSFSILTGVIPAFQFGKMGAGNIMDHLLHLAALTKSAFSWVRSPPPLHRNNRNLGQEGGEQSGNLFLGAPHSFFFPFSASGCLPIIHEHPFWGKKASISVYPRKQHWRVQYIITLDTMLVQVKCILFLTHICLYIHPCICPRIFKASLLSSPFFWQELEWMEAPSASSSASASVQSIGLGAFSKVESSQSQSPPRVWAVRSVVCHETQKFFCLHLPRPTHSRRKLTRSISPLKKRWGKCFINKVFVLRVGLNEWEFFLTVQEWRKKNCTNVPLRMGDSRLFVGLSWQLLLRCISSKNFPHQFTHTCVSSVLAPFSHMQTPLLRVRGIRTCFDAFQKAAAKGEGLRLTPPPSRIWTEAWVGENIRFSLVVQYRRMKQGSYGSSRNSWDSC